MSKASSFLSQIWRPWRHSSDPNRTGWRDAGGGFGEFLPDSAASRGLEVVDGVSQAQIMRVTR